MTRITFRNHLLPAQWGSSPSHQPACWGGVGEALSASDRPPNPSTDTVLLNSDFTPAKIRGPSPC